MIKNKGIVSILLIISLLCPVVSFAATEDWIPEALKPWKEWVLFDEKTYGCPYIVGTPMIVSSKGHPGIPAPAYCAWPGVLNLGVQEQGGEFTQNWQVYNETWISLPGDANLWPQEVTVNGTPGIVLNQSGVPQIRLSAGQYQIKGKFIWQAMPSSITLPWISRWVSLKKENQGVLSPLIDDNNRLWIKSQTVSESDNQKNEMNVQVFRKLLDSVPMTVETLIQLDVSGQSREITLGPALLQGQFATSLESSLPVKLDSMGVLNVQVQPGRWKIVLKSHALGVLNTIERMQPIPNTLWPQEEWWVFEAQPDIRVVDLQGIPRIDPSQTLIPEAWQNFPAFQVSPSQKLLLKVEQRGGGSLQNQLSVNREAWVDFSGNGYTVVDSLSGMMQSLWRLEQLPPLNLGRIEMNGQMQLLTQLPESQGAGIEVRSRNLNLTSVSRQENRLNTLPRNGWNVSLDRIDTQLNLPPGWRVFGIWGADKTTGTWWDSWNVLDAFVVFLMSIAIAKLGNLRFGLLALVTLVLLHQEPGAPQYIWLIIVITLALLRFFSTGKMNQLLSLVKWGSFGILFLIALPFALMQIQSALYPQTENPQYPYYGMAHISSQRAVEANVMMAAAPTAKAMARLGADAKMAQVPAPQPLSLMQQYTPTGIIQTGPGVPIWHWNVVNFSNTTVSSDNANVRIFYSPPTVTRILNIVRVLLLGLLAAHLWGFVFPTRRKMLGNLAAILLVIGFSNIGMIDDARAFEIPSPELLTTLKTRLLQPPECGFECATISQLTVDIHEDTVKLSLSIQSQTTVGVPIPGDSHLPWRVATIDGKPAAILATLGQPWSVVVSPGAHQLILEAALPNQENFTIITPLVPQQVFLGELNGWRVSNVAKNNLQGNSIAFAHAANPVAPESGAAKNTSAILPYVSFSRRLEFDKKFKVETRVKRIAPENGPISVTIPLLPNEQVVEQGFNVDNHQVMLNFSADQNEIVWHSLLPENNTQWDLTSIQSNQFIENWQLSVSPLWHLFTKGFSPILDNNQPFWMPQWLPWPGESLHIALVQPKAIAGKTMTIEKAIVHSDIGKREKNVRLSLSIRSSLGGQHSITLPAGAKVISILSHGASVPINQVDRQVILPLLPGLNEIEINWREPNDSVTLMHTETVDLRASSENLVLSMTIPENRWIIASGGAHLGPSVMVWALVILMMLLGYCLSRYTMIPIRIYDWILLALGMSTVFPFSLLVVIAWFGILIKRSEWNYQGKRRWVFNTIQVLLAIFTLCVFGLLIGNISYGLIGAPNMWIQSFDPRMIDYIESAYQPLVWYFDHAKNQIPQGWVFSLPLWAYRAFMLAWSLWFAFAMIRWLKWGWEKYSQPQVWQSKVVQ